jgi:hypothetical protein
MSCNIFQICLKFILAWYISSDTLCIVHAIVRQFFVSLFDSNSVYTFYNGYKKTSPLAKKLCSMCSPSSKEHFYSVATEHFSFGKEQLFPELTILPEK